LVEVNNDVKRLIADLQCVRTHGEFPKGRNYLYSSYKNKGLVFMGNKKKIGNGKNARLYLTDNSKVKLTKQGYSIIKVANQNNQFL
jgi:hypothetical protein